MFPRIILELLTFKTCIDWLMVNKAESTYLRFKIVQVFAWQPNAVLRGNLQHHRGLFGGFKGVIVSVLDLVEKSKLKEEI